MCQELIRYKVGTLPVKEMLVIDQRNFICTYIQYIMLCLVVFSADKNHFLLIKKWLILSQLLYCNLAKIFMATKRTPVRAKYDSNTFK